jgi:pimeloyl-ACP methyl ester carboxylesterase
MSVIKLAYTETGSGETPIVLLHGYPFNRSMWREQAEALSGNYRVITPDLRGHGETSAAPDTTTIAEMARDVAALLDELRIERAIIGGLSMGGYVTFSFYSLFRERALALILADTRPQSDTEEAARNREQQAEKILQEGMESIADDFLKKVLTPATLGERPEIVARVREMITGTKPEGAAAALRAMAVRPDQTKLLPEIDVPALIIVGSEDTLTTPKDAELMARSIPDSRLKIIEGAAHLSNLERPAEFTGALHAFLDELPS